MLNTDMRNLKGQFIKGKHYSKSTEFKKGRQKPKNAYTFSKGHKVIGGYLKGHTVSKETRDKIRIGNLGKKRSEETKLRISESHKGGKSIFWKGGKSFESYSIDWTKTLRQSIRERDKYTCQLCGEKQNDISFVVHHIDYDKKNSNPNNLTTLCRRCHNKTNYNREKWIIYFKKLYE